MAVSSEEGFEECLQNVLNVLEGQGLKLNLKNEQKKAIRHLHEGHDLLAVLPTGYGKSLIFQILVMMKNRICSSTDRRSVLVICPLMSIVCDQIKEVESMGLTACNLSEKLDKIDEVEASNYQIVYASAESAIDKRFLEVLKRDSVYARGIVACIVDESHTLETWTGLRDAKAKKSNVTLAFRAAYGKLSVLRSFLKPGTPMAAMTGTADHQTCSIVASQLSLKDPLTVYVSPHRENLRFSVKKTTKDKIFSELDWLVEMVKKKGVLTDKTIIFCNTMNDIASVVNFLMLKLGKAAYCDIECIVGIYHSSSWQHSKERVLSSLKGEGNIRIVIASTALSMGVNFPDIRYVINWGPARNILDQHQEAGRAGRDGFPCHNIIVYHGNQLSQCEEQVKRFVNAKNCLRIAAYQSLDDTITSLKPGHSCCTYCTSTCECGNESCSEHSLPFEQALVSPVPNGDVKLTRPVSHEDKVDLIDALNELRGSMAAVPALFDNICSHGFSKHLIEDVLTNCHQIFTIGDVLDSCPVFSLTHALKILEIIQEIFMDIPNFDETLCVLQDNNNLVTVCQDLEDLLENSDLDAICGYSEDDSDELPEVLT